MECTYHYILHCPHCSNERITLVDKVRDIKEKFWTKMTNFLSERENFHFWQYWNHEFLSRIYFGILKVWCFTSVEWLPFYLRCPLRLLNLVIHIFTISRFFLLDTQKLKIVSGDVIFNKTQWTVMDLVCSIQEGVS